MAFWTLHDEEIMEGLAEYRASKLLDVASFSKLERLGIINPAKFNLAEIRNISFLANESCDKPYQDEYGYYYMLGACASTPHPSSAYLNVFKTLDFVNFERLGAFTFSDKAPGVGLISGDTVYIYYADWSTTPPNDTGLITISLADFKAGKFQNAVNQGKLSGLYSVSIDPWILKVGETYYLYTCELMSKYPNFRIYKANQHGLNWSHVKDVYDFTKAESHQVWCIDGLYYVPAFTFINSYDNGMFRDVGIAVAIYRDPLLSEPVTKIPVIPWSGQESDSIGSLVLGRYMYLFYAPYWGKKIYVYKVDLLDRKPAIPPALRQFFYIPNTTYITHNISIAPGTWCWSGFSLFPYKEKYMYFESDVPVELFIEIDYLGFGEFKLYDVVSNTTKIHIPLPTEPFNMIKFRFWRMDGGTENVTVTAYLTAR